MLYLCIFALLELFKYKGIQLSFSFWWKFYLHSLLLCLFLYDMQHHITLYAQTLNIDFMKWFHSHTLSTSVKENTRIVFRKKYSLNLHNNISTLEKKGFGYWLDLIWNLKLCWFAFMWFLIIFNISFWREKLKTTLYKLLIYHINCIKKNSY